MDTVAHRPIPSVELCSAGEGPRSPLPEELCSAVVAPFQRVGREEKASAPLTQMTSHSNSLAAEYLRHV